ncbi:MAG: hypothetical protein WB626_00085 [Bacteroidota bacterium]
MKMEFLRQGREFDQRPVQEVTDFLGSRSLEMHESAPDRLHVVAAGKDLVLEMTNGAVRQHPMRAAFLEKLLKWFSFPVRYLERLDSQTVACVANDFLVGIRSGDVTVVLEDGEALTVTSGRYNRLEDLAILDRCKDLAMTSISRNDFFTRFYSEVKVKKEIVKGDECGFGVNIVNSETGFRALSVYHYILRYICTNGAVMRVGTGNEGKIHYGWPEGELDAWLAGRIEVCQASRAKIIEEVSLTRTEQWDAFSSPVSRRLKGILGPDRSGSLLRDVSGSQTLYDVFNRITNAAKSLDLNRRFDLELLAGGIVGRES